MLKTINLSLDDNDTLSLLGRTLSSPQRLDILKALNDNSMSITELSKLLDQPMSTTTTNIAILEEAGLISTEIQYTKKGKERLCTRTCDAVSIQVHTDKKQKKSQIKIEIPIGNYTAYDIEPFCGIATSVHTVGSDNDVDNFFSPERFDAGLIWFTSGWVEYRISKSKIPQQYKELELSFEACSEAPFYRNNWKSDITVWLNDVEIGTWTSPGDFGGRKGAFSPDWWSSNMSQYGILTSWKITREGSYINREPVSSRTFSDYKIQESPYISVKIGVKKDADYKGGINLFGNGFGDYNQGIVFTVKW